MHDPLRFAVRERLILKAGWFYSRNLVLSADRGLPGLTFVGQESLAVRDKNAQTCQTVETIVGICDVCLGRVSGLPLNDSVCFFSWMFRVSSLHVCACVALFYVV